MSPEKEAELFVTLGNITHMLQQQSERSARIEGKIDMMALWLQSTDQRFTAIMAPYQQKPAA